MQCFMYVICLATAHDIYFHQEVHQFLVRSCIDKICKVSSSTSQRLSLNLRSGLRGANSCVTLYVPPNHSFTNLSLKSLGHPGIWPWCVFLHA